MSDPRFARLRRMLAERNPAPASFVRAPGRVNLIGDHTDYQDGLCFPMAIDRDVLVAYAARDDEHVEIDSLDIARAPDVEPPWYRMTRAVARVLTEHGATTRGFDAAVASTVPVGSGLSSSAAFGVALVLTATSVAQFPLAGRDLALTAQEAEQRASGVPCGVLDQMASVFGRSGHALVLDCRTLTVEPIALPDAVAVVVVHSGVPRTLATSAYSERRAACEGAAARLGLTTLRDATLAQVVDDPFARHVVSENARVVDFSDALSVGDFSRCGALMLESHRSLRDDFSVSTPELDRLVDLSVTHGAFGARLTGAGFGGCIVALVPREGVDAFTDAVTKGYVAATGRTATAFPVFAADGAGPTR